MIYTKHLLIPSGYGTNYIGGTGNSQSPAAWLVPVCIQIAPALALGVGILFMPQRSVSLPTTAGTILTA